MKDDFKWVNKTDVEDMEYRVEVLDGGWNTIFIRSDMTSAIAVAYSVMAEGIYTRSEIRITRVKKSISFDYYSI